MVTNVEVVKKKNENNATLLKRFSRKVQESGVLQRVKKVRYETRSMSPFVKKKKRLNSIAKKSEIQEMIKMGKMTPKTGRRK